MSAKSDVIVSNRKLHSNRTRRVRFNVPCRNTTEALRNESALVLSDDEINAIWWTRQETRQMKEAAEVEARCSLTRARSFVSSRRQRMTCSIQPDQNVIRQIFDKSTLDDSDLQVLDRISLTQQVSQEADRSCEKTQRRRHCVRRVIQVQKFLNQIDESPSRMASLLKVTSLYHSESSAFLAELIGRVDEKAASLAYIK